MTTGGSFSNPTGFSTFSGSKPTLKIGRVVGFKFRRAWLKKCLWRSKIHDLYFDIWHSSFCYEAVKTSPLPLHTTGSIKLLMKPIMSWTLCVSCDRQSELGWTEIEPQMEWKWKWKWWTDIKFKYETSACTERNNHTWIRRHTGGAIDKKRLNALRRRRRIDPCRHAEGEEDEDEEVIH